MKELKLSESKEKLFLLLGSFHAVSLCTAYAIKSKLFALPIPILQEVAISVFFLIYPLTIITTCFVHEIWGKSKAYQVLLSGVLTLTIMGVFEYLAVLAPVHAEWFSVENPFNYEAVSDYETAFKATFSSKIELFFLTLFLYLSSQICIIFCLEKFRLLRKKQISSILVAFVASQTIISIICSVSKFLVITDQRTNINIFTYFTKTWFIITILSVFFIPLVIISKAVKTEKYQ